MPPVTVPWTPAALLALQRSAGNRAVGALLQRQLSREDDAELRLWAKSEQLKVAEDTIARISNDAKTLRDAKKAVVDAAARGGLPKAIEELVKTKHKLDDKPREDEEAQRRIEEEIAVLELVIKDLRAMQGGGLGQGTPGAVESLTGLLQKEFPPDKHTYVVLGNSPAPLLAWFLLDDKFPPGAAVHLPLGGLSDGNSPLANEANAEKLSPGLLDPFWQKHGEKVGAHFEASIALAAARKLPLVVIDFSSTGVSVVFAAEMIERWLQHRGTPLEVLAFAYTAKAKLPEVDKSFTQMNRGGGIALALGEAEKVFVDLDMRKLLKRVLLLKGPADTTLRDIVTGIKTHDRTPYYLRLIELIDEVKRSRVLAEVK